MVKEEWGLVCPLGAEGAPILIPGRGVATKLSVFYN